MKDEGTKKSSYGFSRKKEIETNAFIGERKIRPPRRHPWYQQQVAFVTPVVNIAHTTIAYQRPPPQGNQGQSQKREAFDSIPMSYAKLFPALIQKKLVHTTPPHAIPSLLSWCSTVGELTWVF